MNRRSKGLPKHALPIVMIAVALMILPAAAATGYITGHSAAGGLTKRLINVRPTTNGLADITLNNSGPASPPGAYLDGQTGQVAQLFIDL